MSLASKETQAPQTERVGVMVTPEEKRAVRFVADARGQTESETMRDLTMTDILTEYERIRAIIAENAA